MRVMIRKAALAVAVASVVLAACGDSGEEDVTGPEGRSTFVDTCVSAAAEQGLDATGFCECVWEGVSAEVAFDELLQLAEEGPAGVSPGLQDIARSCAGTDTPVPIEEPDEPEG